MVVESPGDDVHDRALALHLAERPPSWSRFIWQWAKERECAARRVLLTQGTSVQQSGGRTRIEIIHLR